MKPANVMLKPDGTVTLIDFGTAKNYEINYGETTGIGTIGYAAPEQYIGSGLGRTDARTDIYCLGMTLYHLLTGQDPCRNLISDTSIRAVNPALSRGLDSIIRKCTAHQPEDRYQSCEELMYDLENYEILEPLYKKKQKRKFSIFIGTLVASVLCVAAGLTFHFAASAKASETYNNLLYEASRSVDYDTKISLYEQCMELPDMGGRKDAYLGMIQAFKENDAVFTVAEANLLDKYIMNHKDELQANKRDYTEICFETGKLFWYYYDYGDGSDNQVTRAKSAIEWFQDVVDQAPQDYENLGMAKAYASIGMFYRDITTNITEASDKGNYKPLFDNLMELIPAVAENADENEIVRLELVELTRGALQQYATKFKVDGVTEQEILSLYQQLEQVIDAIQTTTDVTDAKRSTIKSLMPDTLTAIRTAYGTDAGGAQR